MNIKQLQKISHKIARDKGFWDSKRNKSELLMLIVTELGEACEALRHDKRQKNYIKLPSTSEKFKKKVWEKNTFEDELADAIIRICDLAESENIDLEWQIKNKLTFNRQRPQLHGKQF